MAVWISEMGNGFTTPTREGSDAGDAAGAGAGAGVTGASAGLKGGGVLRDMMNWAPGKTGGTHE